MSKHPEKPCLQALIAEHGSYADIPSSAWEAWHDANAQYQQARRDQLLLELGKTGQVSARKGAVDPELNDDPLIRRGRT